MEDKAVVKVVLISKIKGCNDKSDSFLSEILDTRYIWDACWVSKC